MLVTEWIYPWIVSCKTYVVLTVAETGATSWLYVFLLSAISFSKIIMLTPNPNSKLNYSFSLLSFKGTFDSDVLVGCFNRKVTELTN